jgi:flagellar basal-body rod modification protein FlgD
MSGTVTSSTAAASALASGTGTTLSGDMNTFLRLLTTQLQNQDPTQPMDANQLTQQLVQFSTVEQQVATNRTLQQLLSLQQAGQLGEAAALVGRRVSVETTSLPLQSGLAEINLPAAGTATRAVIEIRDRAGTLVRSSEVALGSAAATWRWDGTNARGVRQADGVYRVSVAGRGSDGGAVPLGFTVRGLVTGAGREDGSLMLRMGGASVGYETLRDLGSAN